MAYVRGISTWNNNRSSTYSFNNKVYKMNPTTQLARAERVVAEAVALERQTCMIERQSAVRARAGSLRQDRG